MILLGATAAVVAVTRLAPCLGDNTAVPPDPCADDTRTAHSNSTAGVPWLVGGLSVIFLGGVMLATSAARGASAAGPGAFNPTPWPKSAPVEPPLIFLARDDEPPPVALDLETACALTERYLEQPALSTGGRLIGFLLRRALVMKFEVAVSLLLSGCALGPTVADAAKARAVTDLDCPSDRISMYGAPSGSFVVHGCGAWTQYTCFYTGIKSKGAWAANPDPICVADAPARVFPYTDAEPTQVTHRAQHVEARGIRRGNMCVGRLGAHRAP